MVQRLGRVVSVSARSETSPNYESVDSTQRRPTRPRIGVDSADSRRIGRDSAESTPILGRVGSKRISPVMNWYKEKKGKEKKKLTSLAQIWRSPSLLDRRRSDLDSAAARSPSAAPSQPQVMFLPLSVSFPLLLFLSPHPLSLALSCLALSLSPLPPLRYKRSK